MTLPQKAIYIEGTSPQIRNLHICFLGGHTSLNDNHIWNILVGSLWQSPKFKYLHTVTARPNEIFQGNRPNEIKFHFLCGESGNHVQPYLFTAHWPQLRWSFLQGYQPNSRHKLSLSLRGLTIPLCESLVSSTSPFLTRQNCPKPIGKGGKICKLAGHSLT